MTINPREAAQYLRELAIRVERGEVDQVFTVAHKVNRDGEYATESDVQGGTNMGAANAIAILAERIECCTDSSCFPGSIELQVMAISADFGTPDDTTPTTLN